MQIDKMTRRRFLQITAMGAVAAILSGFGAREYVTQIEPSWLDVTLVRLPIKRLQPAFAGMRLAQISDIHIGGWMNFDRLKRVVETVVGLRPDAILLTGDYLLGHHWTPYQSDLLAQMAPALAPLAETAPVYAILGNHDHWTNASACRKMLADAGALVLTNAVHTLTRGADQLHLCGVDDIEEGYDRLDLVLECLPAEGAAILMAHEPDFADTSAASGRIDVQISGHSHGGQVIIPFLGPPVLPRLGKKYPLGLYRVGEMWQYTNRGVGVSRPAVRFNCRPEITLYELAAGYNASQAHFTNSRSPQVVGSAG